MADTQSMRERRQLRADYRVVIENMEASRHDLVRPVQDKDGGSTLHQKMNEIDQLYTTVVHTQEAAYDAQAVRTIAELSAERARKLQLSEIDSDAFLTKLRTRLGQRRPLADDDGNDDDDDNEDYDEAGPADGGHQGRRVRRRLEDRSATPWRDLGFQVTSFFKSGPNIEFMLGPLDVKPKVRQEVQRQRTQKIRDEDRIVARDTQRKSDEPDEHDRTRQVEQMHAILLKAASSSKRRCVPLFQAVVNPDSFAQTVENYFHLAFLVKDGHVKVIHDEKRNIPVLYVSDPETEENAEGEEESVKQQALLQISMTLWEKIVQKYFPAGQKCLMPTRHSPLDHTKTY